MKNKGFVERKKREKNKDKIEFLIKYNSFASTKLYY
jgi:hypothetical protein